MIGAYGRAWSDAWNRFWFTPRRPQTLGLIRILAGSMLVYTHAVWAWGGVSFMGPAAILPSDYRRGLWGAGHGAWSLLDLLPDTLLAWSIMHGLAIFVLLLFTIGWATRWTGLLSFFIVVSYANRTIGAQFGLDQVNALLALYLWIGDAGAAYSVDAWRRSRRGRGGEGASGGEASVWVNLGTRLIQVHLCVVYFFAGLGKAQGEAWLNGDALLMAVSSYEYQSLPMTWLVHAMPLVHGLTLLTLFWELSYAALIWPRLTRPIWLATAVLVHLGIGLGMGMLTFGLAMIYANLAFVEPAWVSAWGDRVSRWFRRG